jgi:hypothetical protein
MTGAVEILIVIVLALLIVGGAIGARRNDYKK